MTKRRTIILFLLFYILSMLYYDCYNCYNCNIENFNISKLPRLYFIVLLNNKDRKLNVTNIIKKHNLNNAQIFKAVNGYTDNLQEFIDKKYLSKEIIQKLRPGAIGCAMSHIKLWEHFLTLNDDIFIVFEDDVSLSINFKKKVDNFIKYLPSDFDICQLLTIHSSDRHTTLSKNIVVNKYVKRGYGQYGTVGYIISRKGILKLLKKVKPIYTTIDDIIADYIDKGYLTSYVPTENIINHYDTLRSTITK